MNSLARPVEPTVTNIGAAFLELMATALGIPMNMPFTRGPLSILVSTHGFTNTQTMIGSPMASLGTAGSTIPGRRAARVPIIRVLRDEEQDVHRHLSINGDTGNVTQSYPSA